MTVCAATTTFYGSFAEAVMNDGSPPLLLVLLAVEEIIYSYFVLLRTGVVLYRAKPGVHTATVDRYGRYHTPPSLSRHKKWAGEARPARISLYMYTIANIFEIGGWLSWIFSDWTTGFSK